MTQSLTHSPSIIAQAASLCYIHRQVLFPVVRMLVLFSNSRESYLPSPLRLPSFLKFSKPSITCDTTMHPTQPTTHHYPRQTYSRESSYDSTTLSSTTPSPPPPPPHQTIHHRRTLLRSSSSSSTPPPSLHGFTELFHSRVSTPFVTPIPSDKSDSSESKRWLRMLRMQRDFHCYRSARLEAAVEAMERGEEPPIREFFRPVLSCPLCGVV